MKRILFVPVFAFVLFLFMAQPGLAQQAEPIDGCDEKDAAIFFVNGIMTTEEDAKFNLDALEEELAAKISMDQSQMTLEDFDKLEVRKSRLILKCFQFSTHSPFLIR